MKKKLLAFCLIFLIASLLSFTAAADSALTVSSAEAQPGETATVYVSVPENTPLYYVNMTVQYDTDRLTLDSIAGAYFTDWTVNGVYAMGLASGDANVNCGANLLTLHFTVKAGAAAGEAAVTLTEVEAYDVEENPVLFNVVPGKVTVKGSAAHEHTLVHHEGKPATCTEKGWEAYDTCACGYTTYKEIPALGHDYVSHPAQAPTATEPGWNAYNTCSRCDYCDKVLIAPTGQQSIQLTVSSAEAQPGETATVYVSVPENTPLYYVNMTVQYDTDRLTLDSIEGAYFTDWTINGVYAMGLASGDANVHCGANLLTLHFTVKTDAAAGEAAVTVSDAEAYDVEEHTFTCSIVSGKVTVRQHEHTLEHHEGQPATCTVSGWKAYDTCTCGYTTYEAIPALGHDKVQHEAKAATCLEKGWTAYEDCIRCDYTTYFELPALGHDPIHHEAKAETCTEPGWEAYDTCSRCDYTTKVEIPAHHVLIAHEGKAPTCTEPGWEAYDTCERCDYTTKVERPALGHDKVHHEAKAETCSEPGWEAYDTCSRCDYTTKVERPALGHNKVHHEAKAETCTEPGWEAYDTCERCDYTTKVERPALGHVYEDNVCMRCGEINMDAPFIGTFRIEESYILLPTGGNRKLTLILKPAAYLELVTWSAENDRITVDDTGRVTAADTGVSYAVASFTVSGKTYSTRCRVDVVKPEDLPNPEQLSDVQLVTTAATAEVFKNAGYATVTVLPVLEQNLGTANDSTYGNGVAISAARFVLETANEYFTLRVKDDRTLEVIPKQAAIDAALAGNKALKTSYSSALEIVIGERTFTTAAKLKLTVKKTKPSVKAKAVVLNSWTAALGEEAPLTLTGAKVTAMTLTNTAPDWLIVDTANKTLALSPDTVPDKYTSGKLTFTCEAKGWAIPVPLTVSYSVKSTAPALKYGTKTVSLMPGTADTVAITVAATKAPFTDTEKYPVTLKKIEQQTGKTYTDITQLDPNLLQADLRNGVLTLTALAKPADSKAHTYRVTLVCAGKDFPCTVKTLAVTPKVTLTAKVTGTINTKIPNSSVTVTLTPKNFHVGSGEEYSLLRVEQYSGKLQVRADVRDLFTVSANEAGNVFSFTEKEPGSLVSGNTYKAVFGVDTDDDGTPDGTAEAALKITFAKTAPAISLSAKAKGSIDVTRPGTAITLTPTLKNWFVGGAQELVFFEKLGTRYNELTDAPFAYTKNGDDKFTVTAGEGLTGASGAYYAAVRTEINGAEYTSKPVKLSVKQGKVAVKSSTTSVVLYKNDKFSRAEFTFTVADETVSPIVQAELDTASAAKFNVIDLGNGTFALEYKDNTLPASFRASTVKLNVYVQGCNKSVSTVKLKVSYK